MVSQHLILGVAFVALASGSAAAQVAYDPYGHPFETYPIAGTVQPNETLGTSPSFEILPNGAYGYGPAVRVVERCQYPDGWNATDFSRDVNGIPTGIEHTCRAQYRIRLHARY